MKFTIRAVETLNQYIIPRHSKFQLWICRIFKITPAPDTFYADADICIDKTSYISHNDIFSTGQTQWQVINIYTFTEYFTKLRVKSLSAITVMDLKPLAEIYILAHTQGEGQRPGQHTLNKK